MSKKFLTVILLCLIVTSLLTQWGCANFKSRSGGPPIPSSPELKSDEAYTADKDISVSEEQTTGGNEGNEPTSSSYKAFIDQRKIIMNAQIEIEVDDVVIIQKNIETLTTENNGYIGESRLNSYNQEKRTVTMKLRVPSVRFNFMFNTICEMGKVLNSNKTSQDVTEQYTDLEGRIKNKKLEEKRILELLQKTGAIKDLLEVERELARVREEIEGMEGQLRLLSNQVSYSTIDINLYEKEKTATSNFWNLGQVKDNAVIALMQMLRALTYLFIYGFIVIVPFLLVIYIFLRIIITIIIKFTKKNKKEKQAQK